MAEDPEKRFSSIMDKLFNAPPNSTSSPSSSSVSRRRKRPGAGSELALVEPRTCGGEVSVAGGAPICRPWDRGDLMRRLATFKSMTWFAKPKIVSAVNCARRGWINVDMDIIACEACGARLLFSTPSSWTQQQVEKAALVFSLKLDNGHKMLCPWINNSCDERLAEFPPAPPPVLVEKYNERSAALLQLVALPVVSFSTAKFMGNPQLEEFLKECPSSEKEDDGPLISIGDKREADSAILYYQGQKLISLCGWEPRGLPYVVDCKDRGKQLVKDSEALNLSQIFADPLDSSVRGHSAAANGIDATSEDVDLSSEPVDSNSVVLDCKLCGASVGLWTFTMLPRPVELCRLIGSTEVNSRTSVGPDAVNVNANDDRRNAANSASSSAVADRPPSLSFTIAGGPPPARQNFKAIISFPVIGQNLRARFNYDSEFKDRKFNNQQDVQLGSMDPAVEEHGPKECGIVEQDVGEGRIEPCDHGQNSQAPDSDQSSCLNHENSAIDAAKDRNNSMPLVQLDDARQDMLATLDAGNVSVTEQQEQNTMYTSQGVGQSDKVLENSQEIQPGVLEIPEQGACLGSNDAVMKPREGETCSGAPSNLTATVDSVAGFHGKEQIPSKTEIVPFSGGKDLNQFAGEDAMEFDPIRQHRHFCPWISASGGGVPGWQQTLSAMQRDKKQSDPSFSRSPQSGSIIKVDDPIASVRKLFKSPLPKRMKLTDGTT